MRRRALRLVPVLSIPVLLLAGASPAGSAAPVIRAEGPTNVHAAAYSGVQTTVWATTSASGRTKVFLLVRGLPDADVGKTLGAHVHIGACGTNPTASGGHYLNTALPESLPLAQREIWLDFTVRPGGFGFATGTANWTIPAGAAKSVVVHENPTAPSGAAGGRLFCTNVPFGT